MPHKILAFAGSPRRNGNSETLLDRAIAGALLADPAAEVRKMVLNELKFVPCQNCGFCVGQGVCRYAASDDMGRIYEAIEECDRFIIASPIYFANVSAQLKGMIDRCQALWARKYLLKRRHPNPDRRGLFLSCGGFRHDRYFKCAAEVVSAWCAVCDVKLGAELFYPSIDAQGEIVKHPTALADALREGRELMK